jgi:hypothetical protein
MKLDFVKVTGRYVPQQFESARFLPLYFRKSWYPPLLALLQAVIDTACVDYRLGISEFRSSITGRTMERPHRKITTASYIPLPTDALSFVVGPKMVVYSE